MADLTPQPVQPVGSFSGLSLWLVTDQGSVQRATLVREMAALRATVPNTSDSFQPHVTLFSGLKSEEIWTNEQFWKTTLDTLKSWRLKHKEQLSSIDCELLDVTTRGMFYQCILIALVPNDLLVSLNDAMRSAFSTPDQPVYFPHASLLYSPMTAPEAKARIDRMEEERIFKRRKRSTGEQRVVFGTEGEEHIDRLDLVAVELWDCKGSVREWRKLERVELSQL